MSLESKHPTYVLRAPDWVIMRDTYEGQRKIKSKSITYLPATSGQIADGHGKSNTVGQKAYDSYLIRAVFHDFVKNAVDTAVGVMHQKPPIINLPEKMESLRKSATLTGESLENLLRKINAEQILTGRVGLLADLPVAPPSDMLMPYIAMYKAEHIINWDKGRDGKFKLEDLQLVVLDESGFNHLIDLQWEEEQRFRVLIIQDGLYMVGIFRESDSTLDFNASALITPSFKGTTLDTIPFVFINTKDILSDPDLPSLLGLANLALAIYRGEADNRQALFMQGQDTLVISGGSVGKEDGEDTRVGAGSVIYLPEGGRAEYIGTESKGLTEQRVTLENDKAMATQLGGALVENINRGVESGEALKTRIASKTATLATIALTGATALEALLKKIAAWSGIDPEQVKVIPNLDFVTNELLGKELLDIMSSKIAGAPISLETIHEIMTKREMTTKEFEEEVALIEAEDFGSDDGDPSDD